VHLVNSFIAPEICREWVQYLESRPRIDSEIFDTPDGGNVRSQARDAYGSRTSQEVIPGDLLPEINEAVARAFHHFTLSSGPVIEWFEQPQVLRYGPGHYFRVHADNCAPEPGKGGWTKQVDRDVSLLIYLNQDFTGGGLSFPQFNYSYQPREGDLVVFPSDNRYRHGALPVQSGVRYAIVSWGAISGEPRIFETPATKVVNMSAFRFS